jgi:hypothetical protein
MRNLKLFLFLALLFSPLLAPSAGAVIPTFSYDDLRNVNYDLPHLLRWYYSDYTRSNTYEKRLFPQRSGSTYRVRICAGAGCPIKIPFVFTQAHLDRVKAAVDSAHGRCNGDAECERQVTLRVAVNTLETIVWQEKLMPMTSSELQKYWDESMANRPGFGGEPTQPARNQQRLMDCVDQASNGTTYLIVLNEEGYLRQHKLINPGINNGIQPHHYSRIKDVRTGEIFQFDLYDRSNTSATRRLPGLVKKDRDVPSVP